MGEVPASWKSTVIPLLCRPGLTVGAVITSLGNLNTVGEQEFPPYPQFPFAQFWLPTANLRLKILFIHSAGLFPVFSYNELCCYNHSWTCTLKATYPWGFSLEFLLNLCITLARIQYLPSLTKTMIDLSICEKFKPLSVMSFPRAPRLMPLGPGQSHERWAERVMLISLLYLLMSHHLAKTLFWAVLLIFCSGNRYAFCFAHFSQVFIELSHWLSQQSFAFILDYLLLIQCFCTWPFKMYTH